MAILREDDDKLESNGPVSFSGKIYRRPLFLIGCPHKLGRLEERRSQLCYAVTVHVSTCSTKPFSGGASQRNAPYQSNHHSTFVAVLGLV
jgi:hypothetical protein